MRRLFKVLKSLKSRFVSQGAISFLVIAAVLFSVSDPIINSDLWQRVQAAPEYPTLQSPVGLSDPTLAFGLDGVTDYQAVPVFLDIVKFGRGWTVHLVGESWGGGNENDLRTAGLLDANGWVTSMPATLKGQTVDSVEMLWARPSNVEDTFNSNTAFAGRYIMKWEGDAIEGWGNDFRLAHSVSNITPIDSNSLSFDWGGQFLSLIIENVNTDYMRNISIVKEEYVPLYEAGEIFNPEYIALIGDARQVRFMDWMQTNNSDVETWEDYTPEGWYTWTGGVPIEVQVKLANRISADPWFNIPFHATDQFIEEFAEYVKANLNPELVASVELSNEVWNWSFDQAQDAHALGEVEFGVIGGAAWVNYYGKRAYETMKIWTDIFGAETSTRLNRVGGIHPGWQGLEIEVLEAPMWQTADPVNYVPPHTYFDSISLTIYFGGREVNDADTRSAFLQMLEDGEEDPNDWLYRSIKGQVPYTGAVNQLQETLDNLTYWNGVGNSYSKRIVAYEGGQHVHHSAFVAIPQNQLDMMQTALTNFIRSQEMADLYEELWDHWETVGDGPFMQFVDVGSPTQYGSWGLYAALGDTTPRATLLENKNNTTSSWWGESRSTTTFQQGRILTASSATPLAGTIKNDFFIGDSNDNTFYPGPGDDGVNGMSGTNTVQFSGNYSEYTVVPEGDGYRVDGPDGSDYLYNIQRLHFEDVLVTPTGEILEGEEESSATKVLEWTAANYIGPALTGTQPEVVDGVLVFSGENAGPLYGDLEVSNQKYMIAAVRMNDPAAETIYSVAQLSDRSHEVHIWENYNQFNLDYNNYVGAYLVGIGQNSDTPGFEETGIDVVPNQDGWVVVEVWADVDTAYYNSLNGLPGNTNSNPNITDVGTTTRVFIGANHPQYETESAPMSLAALAIYDGIPSEGERADLRTWANGLIPSGGSEPEPEEPTPPRRGGGYTPINREPYHPDRGTGNSSSGTNTLPEITVTEYNQNLVLELINILQRFINLWR